MTSTRDFTDNGADARDDSRDERAELDRLRAEVAEWRRRYEKGELRDIGFANSAKDVEPLYTALDVDPQSAESLGVPGTYPFTRGIHPTGPECRSHNRTYLTPLRSNIGSINWRHRRPAGWTFTRH